MTEKLSSAHTRFLAAASELTGGVDRGTGRGSAAEVDAEVDAAADAILPRQVPDDLRWIWHNVGLQDPLNLFLFPELSPPTFALSTYDDFPEFPRALFPICYSSHCFLLMELQFEDTAGPWIYTFEWAGEGIQLLASGFYQILHRLAEELEHRAGRHDDGARLEAIEIESFRHRLISGSANDRRIIDYYDVSSWPQRWQRQQGVEGGDYELRGRSQTVTEFNEARRHGPVTATLVGQTKNLGGSGAGRLTRLTDDTGSVDVFIPAAIPDLGGQGPGQFEIDVKAPQLAATETTFSDFDDDRRLIQDLALSGETDVAASVAARLGHFVTGEHLVVATAIRPVS